MNSLDMESTFTDDLVLPSRLQRWDTLFRFRNLGVNVGSLFLGVFMGKLLSGVLFPSLAERGCYVGWAARAAVPLTSCGAVLLFLLCAVWEACVRDHSDHSRLKQRKEAWKTAIAADETLALAKCEIDERRTDMHRMTEEQLAQVMDAKPQLCGRIAVDDAAAACALLERRRLSRWRVWRGRGLQLA